MARFVENIEMKNETISALMSTNVVTVNVHDHIEKAQTLMQVHKIRHLPVLHKGKLVGMLSLTDLMRLSFSDNFGDMEAEADIAIFEMLGIRHVMKSKPETITPAHTIREVAEILAHREFHALPVVENEQVVGMVTTTDLIRYFLERMDL
ncbi:MAG: CBS domain-containing protein [Lewinellaceae bacterium]|nr:CBS domain-containing protein [Lewinellaceae bacterium]